MVSQLQMGIQAGDKPKTILSSEVQTQHRVVKIELQPLLNLNTWSNPQHHQHTSTLTVYCVIQQNNQGCLEMTHFQCE